MDVLDPLNEPGGFDNFSWSRIWVSWGDRKGKCNIYGTQWLESQTHLKGAVASWAMQGSVVAMLDIGNTLIPCAGVLGIIYAQDMYDHSIDDLSLAICLGVKGSGFGELGIQQWPEDRPECAEEPTVPMWDNGLWDPKVYPNAFK